jgi:hypothetical protein
MVTPTQSAWTTRPTKRLGRPLSATDIFKPSGVCIPDRVGARQSTICYYRRPQGFHAEIVAAV